MKRLLLISAGVLAAGGVAAAPAVAGLTHNPSFSRQIPIRVPTHVHQPQLVDDHGRDLTSPAATVRPRPALGDDRGSTTPEPEPGDDRGATTREPESGDDRGRDSGSDGRGRGRGHDGGGDSHGGGSDG